MTFSTLMTHLPSWCPDLWCYGFTMLIENNAKLSKSPPSLNAAVWALVARISQFLALFNDWFDRFKLEYHFLNHLWMRHPKESIFPLSKDLTMFLSLSRRASNTFDNRSQSTRTSSIFFQILIPVCSVLKTEQAKLIFFLTQFLSI